MTPLFYQTVSEIYDYFHNVFHGNFSTLINILCICDNILKKTKIYGIYYPQIWLNAIYLLHAEYNENGPTAAPPHYNYHAFFANLTIV